MDNETSEIAKLTGRISKDPKSKLFVPLSEAYKKAGDIEMAIYVLLEGLKSNPEYVTARSSLGKLLLVKGDLAGAQKEFEEVVKAIPDNLMARKKLGDLFILQDRPHDALPHYKIALSLNPGDRELASLILDVEAGREVRSKIQTLKAKTTEIQAVKQEPPASGAAPEPAPGPVPPQPSNIEPKTPIETSPVSQPVSPASFTETAQSPAFSVTEAEEPEEVLVVEPLEPETSAQEQPAAGSALSGDHEHREVSSVVAEENLDFDLSAGDQFPEEPVVSRDIRPETELFKVEDRGTIPTVISEETAANEIVETGFGEEFIEKTPEPSFEDFSGKSDDFTTDTLAELYISQGFFEKAIEIYERMLVDQPNSRGLQDKLSWVRAAVVRTAAPASEQKNEADILAAQEAMEYVPVAEAGEVMKGPLEERRPQQKEDTAGFKPEAFTEVREYVPTVEPEEILIEAEVVAEPGEFGPGKESSEDNIFAEAREYKPASGPIDQTTGRDAGFKVFAASPVQAPERRDFEPREYVPPPLEQELVEPSSKHERATRVLSNAGRKETIARLETWLTTIKKEK